MLIAGGSLVFVAWAAAPEETPPIVGRWDLTVHGRRGDYPSWLEVQKSGYHTLVGHFVGRSGSVRPISRILVDRDRIRFSVPPQWERRVDDLHFAAKLAGARLEGTTYDDAGLKITWSGLRAPDLVRPSPSRWSEPMSLFNGKDLTDWKPRSTRPRNQWRVRDGILTCPFPGVDLMTERSFDDLRLRFEFRYPKGSNSGIYLRGRYEVQIQDDHGLPPDLHGMGSIYGFLKPRSNPARPVEEWQEMEITLIGRMVTVRLNGKTLMDELEIPGITGGALDSREAEPGPILIQGDHGPIEIRKIEVALRVTSDE